MKSVRPTLLQLLLDIGRKIPLQVEVSVSRLRDSLHRPEYLGKEPSWMSLIQNAHTQPVRACPVRRLTRLERFEFQSQGPDHL